jgi:hypothetical protein
MAKQNVEGSAEGEWRRAGVERAEREKLQNGARCLPRAVLRVALLQGGIRSRVACRSIYSGDQVGGQASSMLGSTQSPKSFFEPKVLGLVHAGFLSAVVWLERRKGYCTA